MKALWIAIACACVIVPLATSGPSGPQSGALEVLGATAAVLAAAAGAPAAQVVALPPPARRPTAARPASSFLFMMSPCTCLPLVLILRNSYGPEALCWGAEPDGRRAVMSAALEAELDRCGDGDASRTTPSMSSRTRAQRAREGTRGTTLTPARLAHTPHVGSSDK